MMTERPATPLPVTPLPVTLRLAAAVHAVEAAGMLAVTGFSAAATYGGKAYSTANGVELTVLAFIAAAWLAGIAWPIAKASPWTRTPAVLNQLLVIVGGVFLVQGDRLDWGVPALILAAVALGALFVPASLKALNRPE
jgi:hypothetical protein